jgi:hypothetical protein
MPQEDPRDVAERAERRRRMAKARFVLACARSEGAMPILSNPRHEKFAQALAEGKPASAAYEEAGYGQMMEMPSA